MTETAIAPRLRRVRATRYVTAFREGGSLPGLVEADDDGLYVVKFRGAGQGPEGARRGVARRRDRAGARAARAGPRSRGPRPGDRGIRAARGGPRPARGERRHQSRGRLPAGIDHVQRGRRPGHGRRLGGRRRLVRRLHDEPGPDAEEHQPARLARPNLADRPRRRALHPPRLERPGRTCSAAVRANRASTCCCRSPRPSSTRPSAWRRWSRRRSSTTWWNRSRTTGWLADARAGDPDAQRRAYRAYLLTRLASRDAFTQEAERARAA